MATDNVRFIVRYDYYETFEYLDQWNTPERYAEAPVMIRTGNGDERRALSFEEYERSYGDKENYTAYTVIKEVKCPCCASWHVVDSLGGCTEYHGPYNEPYPDGSNGLEYGGPYSYAELPAWVRETFTEEAASDYATA